jgi:hypothetical protein
VEAAQLWVVCLKRVGARDTYLATGSVARGSDGRSAFSLPCLSASAWICLWSRGAHEADVFQELEDDVAGAKLAGEILFAGDLNARIGIEKDWIDTSDIE